MLHSINPTSRPASTTNQNNSPTLSTITQLLWLQINQKKEQMDRPDLGTRLGQFMVVRLQTISVLVLIERRVQFNLVQKITKIEVILLSISLCNMEITTKPTIRPKVNKYKTRPKSWHKRNPYHERID